MIDASRYGPWAFITGGSEGIGACIASDLADSGINTVLVARKPEQLEVVASDIRSRTGTQVRILSLDLTDAALLERVRAVTDDIDVGLLVHTAGASHRTGPFIDFTAEDVLRLIRVNVDCPALLSLHFGTKMAERGSGGIILTGSFAGTAGSPMVATYAGTKAFSQIFSEGLWWEMKRHGVDVLHIVVGGTNTPAMARLGIIYPEDQGVEPEVVARHDPHAAPRWRSPVEAESISYRVEIDGRPAYRAEVSFDREPGYEPGAAAAAMHAVNAIPAVVAAAPGVLGFQDLPPFYGKNAHPAKVRIS